MSVEFRIGGLLVTKQVLMEYRAADKAWVNVEDVDLGSPPPEQPIRTQVQLLDALGHPWEQEKAYMDRVYTERHERGTHHVHHEGCPLCEGRS